MNVPARQPAQTHDYRFESAMHPAIEARVGDIFSLAQTILQEVDPPIHPERLRAKGVKPTEYYARRFQLDHLDRSHRLAQITSPEIYPSMGDWDRIEVASRIRDGNCTLMSMSRRNTSFGSYFELDRSEACRDIDDVQGVLRDIEGDLKAWLSAMSDSTFLRGFYRADGVVQAVSRRIFPWMD